MSTLRRAVGLFWRLAPSRLGKLLQYFPLIKLKLTYPIIGINALTKGLMFGFVRLSFDRFFLCRLTCSQLKLDSPGVK